MVQPAAAAGPAMAAALNDHDRMKRSTDIRENAIIWWKLLRDYTINLNDWDEVKKEFLETYEPKYLAKMICANFADLKQMPNESMNNFGCRVQVAYDRLVDNKGYYRGRSCGGRRQSRGHQGYGPLLQAPALLGRSQRLGPR